MQNRAGVVPFRWDVRRREQLGRLLEAPAPHACRTGAHATRLRPELLAEVRSLRRARGGAGGRRAAGVRGPLAGEPVRLPDRRPGGYRVGGPLRPAERLHARRRRAAGFAPALVEALRAQLRALDLRRRRSRGRRGPSRWWTWLSSGAHVRLALGLAGRLGARGGRGRERRAAAAALRGHHRAAPGTAPTPGAGSSGWTGRWTIPRSALRGVSVPVLVLDRPGQLPGQDDAAPTAPSAGARRT